MTEAEAIEAVKQIAAYSGDPEMAHGMEDDLYRDFVQFIANSRHPEFAPVAKEILKTGDIGFARWCA